MEKLAIKNRKGQSIIVLLEKSETAKGLVFVMHGLGGIKEQPHITTFAQGFKEKDFTVVRFDTTNTFGESDGQYEDATTTNYYEDLEDVINWAKLQDWYQEPFFLVGHSLGGMCTALYAEKHPEKIKGLAPISTVVSGKLSLDFMGPVEAERWRKSGWKESPSKSKPGVIKRLKWSHMEDRLKYDLLHNAKNLTMPVLLVVGEKDESTPVQHQELFFEKIPGEKEIHIIKDAVHNFYEERELAEIKQIFLNWIDKVS